MPTPIPSCPSCHGRSLLDHRTGDAVVCPRPTVDIVLAVIAVGLAVGGGYFVVEALRSGFWEYATFGLLLLVFSGAAARSRVGAGHPPEDVAEFSCKACGFVWAADRPPTPATPSPPMPPPGASPATPPAGVPVPADHEALPTPPPPPALRFEFGGTTVVGLDGLRAFVRGPAESQQEPPRGDEDAFAEEQARIHAVQAIAHHGGERAVPTLVDLLDLSPRYVPPLNTSGKPTVAHAVIEALAERRDPAAVEALIEELERSADLYDELANSLFGPGAPRLGMRQMTAAEDRCRTAAKALGRIGDPRAIPALEAIASNHAHAGSIRRSARRALGELGTAAPA